MAFLGYPACSGGLFTLTSLRGLSGSPGSPAALCTVASCLVLPGPGLTPPCPALVITGSGTHVLRHIYATPTLATPVLWVSAAQVT